MCIHIYYLDKYKFAFNFLIWIFEITRIGKMQEVMNNMYIKVKFCEKKKMADIKIFVSFLYKRKYEWYSVLWICGMQIVCHFKIRLIWFVSYI